MKLIEFKRWRKRFRFGYVVSITGPRWKCSIGVKGSDWENGDWLGGMGWKSYGPLAICRWRWR